MPTLEDFLNTFGAPLAPGDSWADRTQRVTAKMRKRARAMWMKNGYELGDGTWLPLNQVHPALLYSGLENMFGKWGGKDAREYVKFKHSQGSITDLQVAAMKRMAGPYWPDPHKGKGQRAIDEYWTGSHEEPRFIIDMKHKVIVTTAGPNRKAIKLDLGRYSVWAYDERGKDKVIATGNNLREIKKKYGKHLEVIPIPA